MQLIPPELKTFPIEGRLEACRTLADLTRESFDGPMPEGRRGELMILAVWGRSVGSFMAVMLLAEQGYGDQLGMIARALFEGMVDAYWIAKNPVEAQRLATLHFRQTRLLTAENWNEHERRDGDPALPLLAEDIRDRDMLAKLFGPTGQRHWTQQTLPKRIAEVEATVPQDNNGELQARYRDDNKLANLLLHGSAVALNDRISDTPTGPRILAGPTTQHLANGLRHAYWSHQRLALLVAERRAPNARQLIVDAYKEAWPLLQTITGPAIKAAGRNGPCPCGSARKTKDCHAAL